MTKVENTVELYKVFYENKIHENLNEIFVTIFKLTTLLIGIDNSNQEIDNYTVQGELPEGSMMVIENGGSDFMIGDNLFFYSSDNSCDAVLSVDDVDDNGEIINISVSTLGTDYITGDYIFGVSSEYGNSAVFEVDSVDTSGGITSLSIISSGRDYSQGEIINIIPKIGSGGVYTVKNVDTNGTVTEIERVFGGIRYNHGIYNQESKNIITNNFGTGLELSIQQTDISYNQSVTLSTIAYDAANLNMSNMNLLKDILTACSAETYGSSLLNNLETISSQYMTAMIRTIDSLSLHIVCSPQEDNTKKLQTNISSSCLSDVILNTGSYIEINAFMEKRILLKNYASFLVYQTKYLYNQIKEKVKEKNIGHNFMKELEEFVNVIINIGDNIITLCVRSGQLINLIMGRGLSIVCDNTAIYQNERNSLVDTLMEFQEKTTSLVNILNK
jgi:hypothetical protein